MIYGLYLSGQGAEAQAMRQAVLANNLANVQTTAFKPEVPVFRAHAPFDVARLQTTQSPATWDRQTGGVELAQTVTNHAPGPLQVTHGKLDLALAGPGFLQVQQGDQTVLTRNGRLSLDDQRQLVTADRGDPILSSDGQPLVIPAEIADFTISADGLVSGTSPEGTQTPLGQLSLVEPVDGSDLKKLGNSYYSVSNGVRPAAQAQVRQGVLEDSGVQPMPAMVELIETSRAFEMNMNLLRYQDESLGQFLQSIPRR